jgi:carbon-monoxide dehydrogenase large subunit
LPSCGLRLTDGAPEALGGGGHFDVADAERGEGVDEGVGQVLMEDIRFDPASGQLLTGSFMDYAMPRAGDLSAIHCDSNPVPTKTNPLGVKGAGEAGNVGALPAVANALIDALSPLGIRQIAMPATPERLWRAIRGGCRS